MSFIGSQRDPVGGPRHQRQRRPLCSGTRRRHAEGAPPGRPRPIYAGGPAGGSSLFPKDFSISWSGATATVTYLGTTTIPAGTLMKGQFLETACGTDNYLHGLTPRAVLKAIRSGPNPCRQRPVDGCLDRRPPILGVRDWPC